jgi:hypothetical protein
VTDTQFLAWLKQHDAIRCVLIEVNVKSGGVETTRYLSNKGYTTSSTDTPANTNYKPVIAGGIKFNETLSIDGNASLSWGDIEIDNNSGDRDSWFDDVWANRAIRVFIGDVRWPRSDFRLVFDGIVAQFDTKARNRFNLKVSDKMQRLNTPVVPTQTTENKPLLTGGTKFTMVRLRTSLKYETTVCLWHLPRSSLLENSGWLHSLLDKLLLVYKVPNRGPCTLEQTRWSTETSRREALDGCQR